MTKQADPKLLVDRYRLMWVIRLHEEALKVLFTQGKIGGTTHLYIGQEAIAAGVIAQLREDDYIVSTHRGHGHMLAKGGELRPMLAEILGKFTGYCKGKGGSMHIASLEVGNLGANGIVSGGLPISVGSGLSAKMRGTDQVTVVSFSDGATNEGNTHEAMNLAALWKLPVIFLFENNHYAVSTEVSRSMAGGMKNRAAAYHIPIQQVDGNDFEAVHFAAEEAIDYVRSGSGPYLLECETYRIEGHYYGDPMVYRSKEEVDAWRKKGPICRLEQALVERGILREAECREIEAEVRKEVEDAVAYAENSPEPPIESIFEDVFTEEGA
ncbi:MAG: thiamine pyrophosphate-dependent dehydrogenase E1 component subunit alpha [Anaerolineaceae bacterium]|nr:thiamine pyrophosphate-dependent dehydrogenase E1 component subunit alpha [Anaerolineaceae bacterium]